MELRGVNITNASIRVAPGPTPVPPVLLLELDATDYSGSGTTWTANVGTDATLYNTPTYNAASPTFFNFDNTQLEYADTSNLPSQSTWTVETWFRLNTALSTGDVTTIVTDEFDLSTNLNFVIGTNRQPTSSNICVGFFNGAWRTTDGFTPALNTWYHCVGTYDGNTVKQYVNNSLDTQLSYTGTGSTGGLSIRIARRWDGTLTESNLFPGDIAIVRIYNNAMTDGEVTTSWNTDKARFGY
jgi:hypothetical protein